MSAVKRWTRISGAAGGFTLIELLVVMSIIALLASLVAPRYLNSLDRAKENVLLNSLAVMREAIDHYVADKGHYPETLDELVQTRYLRSVPEDPISGRRNTWVILPPPPDAQIAGSMGDVRSGAAGRGADGSPYADW